MTVGIRWSRLMVYILALGFLLLLISVKFNSFEKVKHYVRTRLLKTQGLIVYPINIREQETPSMPCILLKTKYAGATPICVYTPDQGIISKRLLNTSTWEPHLTGIVEELFKKDPNLNLFDFGSNVGAYTILALKSGRQVIAVDPKAENLRRIRMSINKGKLTGGILVQNGLSNFRTTATFHQHPDNGWSYLTDSELKRSKTHQDGKAVFTFEVKTILLSDLIPLVAFKRAMIKIDVEGFELKAFQTLDALLEVVDIPFILMEWTWIKVGESGKRMVVLMHKLGYQCFVAKLNGALCAGTDHTEWPKNVVWVRTNTNIYSGASEAIRIWNGSPSAPATG